MKRIALYLIALVAGFTAVSCVREERAVYNESEAIAPIINSFFVNEDGDVIVNFTPGSMGQSFNNKMPVNHSLVLLKADDKTASRVLTSSVDGDVITVTSRNLSRGLAAMGYVDGDVVGAVELSLRASLQEQARDNGRNGYIESEQRVNLEDVLVSLPQESPYKEYTKLSNWTVIGSIAAYEMDWNKDLVMWTDGNHNFVAPHVTLGKNDEFKFRQDMAWDVNLGGEFGGLDSEFEITEGGANIKVGEDGIFDIFFNEETKKAWVLDAFDPYPAFTESSDWSVIGNLKNYNIEWNDDIAMISDGTSHLALGVSLDKADEFKFRKDKDWTVNLGGEFGGLGNEFPVTQDGANIKVGEEGEFDLLINPEAGTAMISESAGAKVSYLAAVPEEPVEEVVWGIIGLNGDWDHDINATEQDGVWSVFVTAESSCDFKWRKNGSWDENYGGVMKALGEPFAAVAGGDNIKIAVAGFYQIVLDLSDAENPTITISEVNDVYSLIGKINGTNWDTDFDLAEDAGVFTSEVVYIDGGFKIRHNYSWADADTYGAEADGFTPEMGAAFTVVQPGKDITLPAGNYRVQFTLETKQVVITKVDYELPEIDLTQFTELPEMAGATTWGIIGPAQAGGWNTDTDLQKIQDEPEVWAVMNIPLQADKFKFRGNDEWGDYDLGGGTWALNEPFVMTKGGGDMSVELGVYTVYLYPTYGVAYFTEGSGDVPPPAPKPTAWSLIGTIGGTSWDTDFDLTNTSGDKWEIKNVTVTASDEFKIRADHDWGKNYGGPEGNGHSTINPDDAYEVYVPTIGTAFAAGGMNIQIGVAGAYNVIFDYAAETILIEEYKEYPDALYMIGDEFGAWDWESDGVVEMTPVLHNPAWGANAEAQFWTVRYFSAGKGFKFNSTRAWGGDFWGLETNDGFTEAGGNCTVAEDGYYMVHIDLKNGKVHVEPARVFLIGDATNLGGDAWNEEVVEATEDALFKTDGKVLKAKALKGGNLRMYAASAISTSAAWTREFNIYDGKIVCRGNGGDQEAVPVLAEQVVTLDFNAGIGSIEGEGTAPAFKPEITVAGDYSGCSWSADNDPKLQGKDGVFKGALVMNGGSFKFVHDGTWIGGVATDLTYALNIGGGDNMTIADGTYFWTVDLAAESPVATALAVTKVGLIGTFNGWSDDVELAFNSTDLTYSGDVTLEAGAKFKVRFNGNWDYALGGALDKLSAYGGDIEVADAGTYKAVVDLNKATVTLIPAN